LKLNTPSAASAGPASGPAFDVQPSPGSEARDQLVSLLTGALTASCGGLIEEFVGRAVREVQRDRQQALLEAVSAIRTQATRIVGRFGELLAEGFDARLAGRETRPTVAAPQGLSLSLVDDEVISERIELDRIVQKLRGKLDPDQVLGLRARLAAIAGRNEWFDENRYPGAPDSVVDALRTAIGESCAEPSVRAILLESMAPALHQPIGEAYEVLNARLVERGILPRVVAKVAAAGSAGPAGVPVVAPVVATVPGPAASGAGLARVVDADLPRWFGLLFEHLAQDPRIHPDVTARLIALRGALERDLAGQAGLFGGTGADHPVRRVLELACQLGSCPDLDPSAASACGTAIAATLDRLAGADPVDWTSAADALEALLASARLAIDERHASDFSRASRLESFLVGQSAARSELRALPGLQAPRFVMELIDRIWSRVVAIRAMSGGQAARDAAMLTAATLAWSAAPKSASELDRLKERLPGLLGEIRQGLREAGLDEAGREHLLQRLLKWHTRLIQQAKGASTADLPGLDEAMIGVADLEPIDGDSLSVSTNEALAALSEGDTVEFVQAGSTTGRMRVSWVGGARRLFLLTCQPDVSRLLQREELARLLASGEVRVEDRRSSAHRAILEIGTLIEAFRPD
jgi:hypothetical protein